VTSVTKNQPPILKKGNQMIITLDRTAGNKALRSNKKDNYHLTFNNRFNR